MMLTTMMVITTTMTMMMKGDDAGKKKRIKPDFAQFYMQSPVFDVSVGNNLNVELSIVAEAFVLALWAEGGTITPPIYTESPESSL